MSEKRIRKCPCKNAFICEAYKRLYPIDPKCVYGFKEDPTMNIPREVEE